MAHVEGYTLRKTPFGEVEILCAYCEGHIGFEDNEADAYLRIDRGHGRLCLCPQSTGVNPFPFRHPMTLFPSIVFP